MAGALLHSRCACVYLRVMWVTGLRLYTFEEVDRKDI